MYTRYRDRQHVQRYPRDGPYYNDPQYTQQRSNRQFYTSNVYQTQRPPTRINRPESYQSQNNRNRRQSPPYNAPVRNERVVRSYINNISRPQYDYYPTSTLQQQQQPQPLQQPQFLQNSTNTSTLTNDNNQHNNNINSNNNNNNNVGAHGLYEHLEVEKSMGVSPAPEIPVNNNLDDSIPRKNKNSVINKTIVSSVNNVNNNNNNINDNSSNQVHLVPLQTTRNQDGQNRSQDVRYTQNTFINKDKTHLQHRPLPLKPGVYINRQIINHHNNNRNKDKRKHEERNFIQQYPNTTAYKEALQQSLSRYKHQQQLQQATSYISQGGTSLAYDITEDYQNNINNNININTKKKSKSKKRSKVNNTNNTTQIPQVGYSSKYYPSYDPYSQSVRARGALSYDGNWYPFPTYPDPYLVQAYENKKSNQKSSSRNKNNNSSKQSEPEDKSRSVRKQVEFYFSDKNLKNDTYTKALMSKDGWVRASDLHAFPRLKRMGANSDMILKACENSKQIEVRGRYIRKKNDWQQFLPDLNDTSKDTIKAIVTKIENIQKRIKNTEKAKKKQMEKEKEEKKEQNQTDNNNNNNNDNNNTDNNNDNDNNNNNNNNNNDNTNTKQDTNTENTTNNTETSSEFEKISKSTSQVQSLNTSFEENDKNNDNTQPTNTSGSGSDDDDMICID